MSNYLLFLVNLKQDADAYKHRRLPLLCNVIYTYIPYATHDILIRLSLRCASLDLGYLVKH